MDVNNNVMNIRTINCEFDEKKGLDASDVTGYKTAKEKKSFRSPLSRKER